ncbi:MAG: sigma-70 family RNA polymerase sigma factor [Cytophagaceae bacterium]|nr:sigma-70 family RNA polymerase sigma factor [Cytophagaceae bacterium]
MKGEFQFSDEDFLAGIRMKNEHALSVLYKSHFPMVLNFILNNRGTEEEAKDIYQEAIIIFYEKVRDGMQLSCKIKTFIYSVCRRQWLKRLYEKTRYPLKIDDIEEFIEVEEEIKNAEDDEQNFHLMEESMNQLGEPCRTIIEDFYISHLSMEEISDKFGYTNADNAKNQKYKCLQRLKKLFFESYKKEDYDRKRVNGFN